MKLCESVIYRIVLFVLYELADGIVCVNIASSHVDKMIYVIVILDIASSGIYELCYIHCCPP